MKLRIPKRIHLKGKRIYLREMRVSDASKGYVQWLNDSLVNCYLESRFQRHTVSSVRQYIRDIQKSGDNVFLAIVLKEGDQHIGNIKLGPIDPHHLSGYIGIMIGEKNAWGHGYGSDAIKLLTGFAFRQLKIHRVSARLYVVNKGSFNAFKKAGFKEVQREKKSCRLENRWIDAFVMSRNNGASR